MTLPLLVCLFAIDSEDAAQRAIRDMRSGRIGPALAHAKEAAALSEREGGPDSGWYAHRLALYGEVQIGAGLLAEGRANLERAYAIAQRTWPSNDPDYIALRACLGIASLRSGRPREAETFLRRALLDGEALLGPDHHEVGIILEYLAVVLRKHRRNDEAKPLAKRARTILGPPDSTVSAWSLRSR
ncbi:MAG: tetratricopeptide repeat protein [Bryobacteraceae bacterium]|nr:tetratricopeptide repeat protein [Bryobacteraceae bacterium]